MFAWPLAPSFIHREDEGVDSPFRVLSSSAKQVMAGVDWELTAPLK
jgi:hypothetical protein